ncbi:trk system potassium uptake protein TrkA [Comamonas sp. BIGb0124]|uniref:Trk system potassium transporter TrkA n=1 Tax=Comamonas sp. BIGb0124 TaxID=2485130 RepID=UPI000F46333F|nr:Trk system potassium transporter TrkA [Comamonas sp. BIGb0124]ROR16383.1 trk system potassium uptake protein TrkA [Comamonas sp. BIGb0124]
MKIIILGAGRVGESVAESLVFEGNDITVIDTDAQRLRSLEDRFDLRGVVGSGIQPRVLAEAGAHDADLFIACAALDETNLAACKIAHASFNVPTRIARVRAPDFREDATLLSKENFAVDCVICPEESITRYIDKLVDYPEALQVREFAGGAACLLSVRAVLGAPMVHHSISELAARVPNAAMRIVAIYRRLADQPDRFIVCKGSTRIEAGDEVFVLSAREHVEPVLAALHHAQQPVRRIMIAGGGRVGESVALALARKMPLKIIEADKERCVQLASRLPSNVLVLNGDATDEDLLEEEHIEGVDLFLALTSDDEDNIMSCLLAKRMGATRVLSLLYRRSYADLMHGTQIDIALSPSQAMLGELLAYVRRGDVEAVHSLRRGVAEALEIVVRGDAKSSRVVGERICDVKLPEGCSIGLVVRGMPEPAGHDEEGKPKPVRSAIGQDRPRVLIASDDLVIESNDHVVIFLPRKRLVREIEKLFQPRATFFG